MYQNRIRQTPINRNPQSFVSLARIAYDERIAFVDRVCATLIESRFGPGYVYRPTENPNDRPELEPAFFYDLLPVVFDHLSGEMAHCYEVSPVGRKRYQPIAAAKVKYTGILAATASTS